MDRILPIVPLAARNLAPEPKKLGCARLPLRKIAGTVCAFSFNDGRSRRTWH